MKKILFVHHSAEIGGGSYCLLNLLKAIDKTMFLPLVLLKNDGPLVEEINKLGIKVYFLSSLTAVPYNKPLFIPQSIRTYSNVYKSLKDFKDLLQELNIDVLYLNNSMLYPYLRIGREFGVQTAIHIREHWPIGEHTLQFRWFQKEISEYADKIVAINQYSASMIPGVEHKKVIIYDWIDFTDRDAPCDLSQLMGGDVSDKKVFLYTGGMQDMKGVCEVLESFSELCGEDSRLLAMGVHMPTFDGMRGRIKILLKYLGYNVPSVRIYEVLKRDDRIVTVPMTYQMKNIIRQSYCVLSYFKIPHANLILAESIILQTPVIAAKTPEALEYSLGGSLAELCDFLNIKEFQELITEIDKNVVDLKCRLQNSSYMIEQKFDRTVNVEIFNRLLKSFA